MNRYVGCLLMVLTLLLLLPGCSTLQALEQVTNKKEIHQESDSSLVEPDTESSSNVGDDSGSTTSSNNEEALDSKESPDDTQSSDHVESPDSAEPSAIQRPEEEMESEPEDSTLTVLQNEICQSGDVAGVAFIGYMSSDSSEMDLRDKIAHSDIGKKYPFLNTAMLLMTEGDELYAIVPPVKSGEVKVYPSTMSESGEYMDDKSTLLFDGLPGEPVIVLCNLSDIYSNVLITVSDGGEAIEVRPGLSGEDGRLVKEPRVYDFSIYEKPLDENSVDAATQMLLQTAEIQLAVQQGMSVMYTGDTELIDGQTCLLFALGTDHDEHFVREYYYAVGDGIIYVYDAVFDTWNIVRTG